MSQQDEVHFLELLISKVCHDLISPIGAVNNGVEFLQEMGPDAGDEATDLIAYSAQQASAKLKAFRMAYGLGGADPNLKPDDSYQALESIISADGKVKQDWDSYGDIGFEDRPDGFCKVLTCTLLLAMDSLPKGGTISVRAGGPSHTIVEARGDDAGLKDQTEAALNHELAIDALEPKYVHAHASNMIAKKYGLKISKHAAESGLIAFSIQH